MKYNDNGTIKEIKVKAVCDVNVVNEKSNSTKDTYCCDYINKFDEIGSVVNLFGNIAGTSSTETVSLWSHIVATKLGTNGIWKFDIEGTLEIENPNSENFVWGIMPTKISELLNNVAGVQVQYDSTLLDLGTWNITKKSDKLPYIEYYNYGTTFEYNGSAYMLPARYYTYQNQKGGYSTASFESETYFKGTIYLREI